MSESLGIAYVDEEWEHGLRCADCNRLMQHGDRYSERLDSFMDETPMVVIVCVGCAVSNQDRDPASEPEERGEFHAEGLDERGIYGGRSYPATSRCEKCKHEAHEPGACGVNVGTGYQGAVLCRCGVPDPATESEAS